MNKAIKCTLVLFLSVSIYGCNTANAQIKVVGEDYSKELTAKDFYSQDVSFENYFPHVDIRQYSGVMGMYPARTINQVGDTVWIGVTQKADSYKRAVCNNKALQTIPSGYYVISGYIWNGDEANKIDKWFRENGSIDRFGHHYTSTLKNWILDVPNPDEKRRREAVIKNLAYIKLTSVDTSNGTIEVYYENEIDNRYNEGHRFLPDIISLRFYNEIRDKLINKDVVFLDTYEDCVEIEFTNYKTKKFSVRSAFIPGGLTDDHISGERIQLKDSVFKVIDVVMKEVGKGNWNSPKHMLMYIILQGENTGSFAKHITETHYDYSYRTLIRATDLYHNNVYYSGNMRFIDMPHAYCYREFDIVPVEYLQKAVDCSCDSIKLKVKNDAMAAAERERQYQKDNLRWQQEKEKEAAERQQKMVAKFGSKYGVLVAKKQISTGMTKEMCREAWGGPVNSYRTTTSFGQSEVWCYNYKTKVYFFNGSVVQIDD